MYTELEIISKIKNKADRINLALDFIIEYGGWLQHLSTVGQSWGADGEEVGANKESIKTISHLKNLKNFVVSNLSMQK